MRKTSKRGRLGPPRNPGLKVLIEEKRIWSKPLEPDSISKGFRGWHERGYLPHRDEPGLTQFITFRLADSFPEHLRCEWEHLLKIEDDVQRRFELEAYLDKGRGRCLLRRSNMAEIVENAILFFEGDRYDLISWVIMPNHVHVLFKVDSIPMTQIVESWKKHTSNTINRLLRRKGIFWQADYWDTYMRDSDHELEIRKYIENNPARAKLVLDPKSWQWSSARFRNEYGVLKL